MRERGSDCNATLPILLQYFSSHRCKSTTYAHDLWTRSKSNQTLYDSGIVLTHGDPHGDPCHGCQVTRFASLSLSRLSETQQKALRRNGSSGGPAASWSKKSCAGKDQCCFRTIVQDLVIADFVCYLGCRFCWY